MSVRWFLDFFDSCATQATFFVLGWVVECDLAFVREIVRCGHEVVSHGHGHVMLGELGPDLFCVDLCRAWCALEDVAGAVVVGYCVFIWLVTLRTSWVLDVFAQEGYRYDLSIFSIRHDCYGDLAALIVLYCCAMGAGVIVEFLLLVFLAFGMNLLVVGGGYLCFFFFVFTRLAIWCVVVAGWLVVLYLHLWEVDFDQLCLLVGFLCGLRHYVGIWRVERCFERIFCEHCFGCAIELVEVFERADFVFAFARVQPGGLRSAMGSAVVAI